MRKIDYFVKDDIILVSFPYHTQLFLWINKFSEVTKCRNFRDGKFQRIDEIEVLY